MDTDWCLTCDKHLQSTDLYCSAECQDRATSCCCIDSQSDLFSDDADFDDDVIYHHVDEAVQHPKVLWTGNGSEGILAWAADIPPPSPAAVSPLASQIYPSSSSTSTTNSPNASTTMICRPPKLLQPTRRPVPPTLCMSTPHPAPPPSHPILTPKQQFAALSRLRSDSADSVGKTSLGSGATESSLATPASAYPLSSSKDRSSFLGAIASHVRSWVSPSQLPTPSHSPNHFKRHLSSPSTPNRQLDPHKFAMTVHGLPPTANVSLSTKSSAEDQSLEIWQLPSTIVIDQLSDERPVSRSKTRFHRVRGHHLPLAIA